MTGELDQMLSSFMEAAKRHSEAKRSFNRANRLFCKLADRIGEDRAWKACGAGVEFADRRTLRAYGAYRQAGEALADAVQGMPLQVRLKVFGILACMRDLARRSANDNRMPDRQRWA